jgi:hypothetical protein
MSARTGIECFLKASLSPSQAQVQAQGKKERVMSENENNEQGMIPYDTICGIPFTEPEYKILRATTYSENAQRYEALAGHAGLEVDSKAFRVAIARLVVMEILEVSRDWEDRQVVSFPDTTIAQRIFSAIHPEDQLT